MADRNAPTSAPTPVPDCSKPSRYPLEALAAFLRTETDLELADAVGVTRRTVQRWKRSGVTEAVAYEVADRLRESAYIIWPELLEVAIEDAEKVAVECAARDCSETFIPSSHRQKFHDPRCREREKVRRWRSSPKGREAVRRHRTKPKVAAKNRERRRRYYAENGAYERARQRRYDASKRAA